VVTIRRGRGGSGGGSLIEGSINWFGGGFMSHKRIGSIVRNDGVRLFWRGKKGKRKR